MSFNDDLGLSEEDLAFIEEFYTLMETSFYSLGKNYTRPENYLERAERILKNRRNTCKLNKEGRTGTYHQDL